MCRVWDVGFGSVWVLRDLEVPSLEPLGTAQVGINQTPRASEKIMDAWSGQPKNHITLRAPFLG